MDAENKLSLGANAMAPMPDGLEAAAMAAATSEAVIAALQAMALVPDASGQVVLPAGTELDDIRVSGRDLIITMPDGTQMIIPDGAIFVPQFVLDGIAVPPLNIAALLISQETAPAAGRPNSSGGNFAEAVGDIGDPFARGNLLPPTQLAFGEPEEREIIPALNDEEPTTIIITPDQPAGSVSATDRVSEAGLPARGSESAGSNEAANSETTAGSIVFQTPDGFGSITLNGTAITTVGQIMVTPSGRLTITSIAPGNIGYSYTLTDNASGDNTSDIFVVVVTDRDGDTSTADLTISIIDDVPTARNDTDALAAGSYGPETGNVLTGVGTTSGSVGWDTQGADGAALSGIRAGSAGAFVAPGGTLSGAYGTLTVNTNGSYSYVRNPGTPGGVNDVFSYQITDGDGDTSTATLTISIADAAPTTTSNAIVFLDDDALAGGNPGGVGDDTNAANTSGTLSASGGDGPLTWSLSTTGAPAGFSYVANGSGIDVLQGTTLVLRVTLNTATGAYNITQLAPVQHVAGGDENNAGFTLSYSATDADGDGASGSLTINVDDDTPVATNDTDSIASGSYRPATGNVITDVEGDGGADSVGADGGAVSAIAGFGGAGLVGGITAGQYGVLTLNADGSYSYVRNAGTPGGVNDVFTYTLTDGDGDTATATLTISIADGPTTLDLPTTGEAGTLVDEAGLPAGSHAASSSETTAGTIAYTAPDGPAIVTIDGIAVTAVGQIFTGAFGTMTITSIAAGAIGYSYTLTTNTSGDNTFDDFAIVVTDQDGDATAGTLVIDIIDDVPTARPDIDSVTEDTALVADGNIISASGGGDTNATDGVADTRGADGATVTAIAFGMTAGTVGGATAGAYGTLTLNGDGSYSYVLNNADPAVQGLDSDDTLTEVFAYTLTDSDGDIRTTTLTITVNGSDDPITIGGLNVRSPELIVDEDDLADGSSPNPAALTQAGTFTVHGTDGISAILIEGTNVVVGQTFTTAYGTFTITAVSAPVDGSATAITIGYSYTLTDNTAHPAGLGENFITEIFDIAVTDTDGSTDAATIEVQIIDDVPAAVNDTDTVAGGTYGPETGNVITDAEADGGADTRGADGAAVTAVSGAATGAVNGSTPGTYGVLTLNADGSYSYVRNAGTPGGVDDVFSYTITDSDGDSATATLTISIADALPITAANGTVLLDDDALAGGNPGGTGDDADAANLTGTLSASGGDGPLIWSLSTDGAPAGFTYVANGTGVDLLQGAIVVLRVTLNTATGAYTVTQLAPIQHLSGIAENNTGFSLSYAVTDQDADTAGGTLTINVDDDTPTAVSDTDTILGGSALPATGNVITDAEGDGGADSVGADGGAAIVAITGFGGAGTVGGVTNGQYGVLTINSNGDYSYVRNGGTPGDVSDVFTYMLTDADGDTITATLTITIEDEAPIVGPNAIVLLDDDTQPGGNAGGTGDDADAANLTGTLSGSGGDGALAWAFQLTGAPAGFTYVAGPGGSLLVQQGATSVLTITLNAATGAYTVTQNAPIDHVAGGNENNQPFTLNYTVTDVDGDIAGATLSINVDDDTVVLANDTDIIASGTYGPATGNVLTDAEADGGADSLGADGGSVTAITGFGGAGVIGGLANGQYGVLTLNANGSYSYVRNAGTPGGVTDTFTYTVTDGDGDIATATLTISIADSLPITRENGTVLLDDDALSGGNAGGTGDDADAANLTGTLAASGGDGPLTWSLATGGAPGGFSYVANGTGINVFQGATQVLAITLNAATGGYVVTQLAPIDHAAGGDENNQPFTLNYTVTDQDGDTAGGTLAINIDDDTPVASDDTDGIASGSYGPATGNVITDTEADGGADSAGADGGLTVTAIIGAAAGTVGGTTAGSHGVLTLNADGSYSYVRNAGTPGGVTDTFTYTVTDGDGDSATATLMISIADARPVTAENGTVLLDDDAFAGGNPGGTGDDADAANLTGTLAASGGDGPLTWSLATGGAPGGFSYVANGTGIDVLQGATVVLRVTLNMATGAYTVTQLAPINHVVGLNENNVAFTLSYAVTDQDSDTVSGTLTINVDDDTPTATNDSNALLAGATGPAMGNVLGNDSDGADATGTVTAIIGSGGAGIIGGVTTGAHGTLTINANGSYSYVRSGGGPINASDVFTYTLTDADGDPVTATLTITLADATPITGLNATVLLDDDALAGGNAGGTGDDADAANLTGTLAGSGGDGALSWTFQLTGAPAGFTYVAGPGGSVLVQQGAVTVLTITLNAATGAYTVTQNAPIQHPAGGNENNTPFTLNYTVADADGDTAGGALSINVDDDTPTAVNDTDAVTEDGPSIASGNVLTGVGSDSNAAGTDSLGADGPVVGGAVTGISGGMLGVALLGTYGSVTLNTNGSYSYTLNNALAAVQALDSGETRTDVFTYTITDRDGDSTTATLTITITGTNDAPVVTPATTAVSEEGLAGANPDNVGTADTTNNAVAIGTIIASDVDIEPLTFTLGTPATALTSNGVAVTWVGAGTGTLIGSAGATEVIRITIDATGNYTVTLSDQVDHPVTGSEDDLDLIVPVAVSDGTATTATTLTISIEDDSAIAITATTPGTVDEDGLSGGIAGGTGDVAGIATTATGSVTGLFAGGADAPVAYSLSTVTAGLPTLTSGGAAITYAVVGNVLTASAGVNPVFTLTLNATTGQWDFVLLRPVDHANAANENDLVLQFGSMVIATDRDGDPVTAIGNLTVTIDDDTPIANPDSATQATENAPVTINVFGNDQGGADGTLVSTVAAVGGSLSGTGVLVDNANGTFTYTPGAGETGAVTFQYTITDRDGDTSTATATITLLADSTPVPVNVVAAVDDDALTGGNPASVTGDIDANTGEPGATPSEALYTGAIAVNFGNDTGTVSFANLHGTTGSVGTETVTYTWNAGTNTLTATGLRGVVFTVSLAPSGAYTVTLVDNVLHASGGNETNAPIVNLNYLATDSDGDSSTAGALAITFNDDAPTLGIVQNQQRGNAPTDPVATGTLHFAAGADGAGAGMTITANMTGITSGGRAIFTQQVGNVLTGYADTDSSGGVSGGDAAVFTLTVNPTAGTSGQYVFDLLAALDGSTTNVSVGSGSSFGSGPSNSIIVADNASGTNLAIVTGWEPTGGFTPAEFSAWQAGGIPVLTQRSDVNGSTSGWGLANNNFDGGEFLRFDFGVVDDYDGPGAYVPPVAGPFANVSYASFSFFNFVAGDTIVFVAHYTNGTTATFTRNGATDPSTFTINAPSGTQIAWIDAYQSAGSIKLNLTDVGVTSTVVDRTIPFTLTLTDGDGDATSTNAFSVRVGGGLSPFVPAANEGIDLTKFGIVVSETLPGSDAVAAPAQIQNREMAQTNALVAASLIALVGADAQLQESGLALVRDDIEGREVGVDQLLSNSGPRDPVIDVDVNAATPQALLSIEPIEQVRLDDMPNTQLWDTIGLAPQDQPVVQYAPIETGNAVQLPSSGASMLTLPTDTGLIDALLLVRGVPADAADAQTPALHEAVADALNDNGIDRLLDQLSGPAGESVVDGHGARLGIDNDIASALINMPVASDAISQFSSTSISDQLHEMATNQG
jgi:large repetitive protein